MKPKIIYIDDEPQNLVGFKALFREEFDIATFSSALEGLELLKYELSNPVQVIISDQRMPEMSGGEFFTHIPKIHQHATKILLTAFSDVDATKHAINEGGITFYYNKPFDEDELRKVLHKSCSIYDKKVQIENEVEQIKNTSKLQIQTLVIDYEKRKDALSEELHEEIAQNLASLKLFLYTLESNKDSPNFYNIIKEINSTLNKSINEIRDVCFKAMPRTLKTIGLKGTLFELISIYNETLNADLKFVKYDLPALSYKSHLFIYSIFEEVLNSFFSLSITELIQINITVQSNLEFIFDGKISIFNKLKLDEVLVSKIEAYNGEIIKKDGQLKLLFDGFS